MLDANQVGDAFDQNRSNVARFFRSWIRFSLFVYPVLVVALTFLTWYYGIQQFGTDIMPLRDDPGIYMSGWPLLVRNVTLTLYLLLPIAVITLALQQRVLFIRERYATMFLSFGLWAIWWLSFYIPGYGNAVRWLID